MTLSAAPPAPSCTFCDADVIGYSEERHRHEVPTTDLKGNVTGQTVAIICDDCAAKSEKEA